MYKIQMYKTQICVSETSNT